MLAIAASLYAISKGRVLFFPFVVILGLPLAALFRRRPCHPERRLPSEHSESKGAESKDPVSS